MQQLFESLGAALGNGVTWLAQSGALFAIFATLWLIFGVALVWRHQTIDQAWRAIRAMPTAVQIAMWLLLLPMMVGLWVWERTWPLVVRATAVVGIAAWNLIVFLPTAP